MTQTVGAYDAKTHLSDLLDRVARGEEITITRHGHPVARLVPVADHHATALQAAAELRDLRRGHRLGGLDWKVLRDEGRR
jgi:prevent-host-death family protein